MNSFIISTFKFDSFNACLGTFFCIHIWFLDHLSFEKDVPLPIFYDLIYAIERKIMSHITPNHAAYNTIISIFKFSYLDHKSCSLSVWISGLPVRGAVAAINPLVVLPLQRWEFIKENKKIWKQENKKTRKWSRKKESISFFLGLFLGRVLVFLLSYFRL